MTYGAQKGKLVPCTRSTFHGHHPESEACGDCPPGTRDPSPCFSCKQDPAVGPHYFYCDACLDSFSFAWGTP